MRKQLSKIMSAAHYNRSHETLLQSRQLRQKVWKYLDDLKIVRTHLSIFDNIHFKTIKRGTIGLKVCVTVYI